MKNTFENFIVNDANKEAFDLANKIARDEKINNANPLVIYGAKGSGKSHLLDAIFFLNTEVSKNHNEWLSSDAFQTIIDKCNQDTNKLTNFKQISLILIDDIDSVDDKVGGAFIAEVLEKLINDGKQICVACTELPNKKTSPVLKELFNKGKCIKVKNYKDVENNKKDKPNILRANGKLTALKVKECFCIGIDEDGYRLTCTIKEMGSNFYSYKKGQDYIAGGCRLEKLLYLSVDAKKTINDSIDEFDRKVEILGDKDLKYFKDDEDHYSAIRKDKYGITYKQKLNIYQLASYACDYYDDTEKTQRTILRLASENNDHILYLKLKVEYKEATNEEINELSKLIGKRILPTLSCEYDKYYIVTEETIDFKLLTESGYDISHRPYFAMMGYTHERYRLNPYRKDGSDATKQSDMDNAITFEKYLKMFD